MQSFPSFSSCVLILMLPQRMDEVADAVRVPRNGLVERRARDGAARYSPSS